MLINCIRSSRKIEQACKRDINFMFLLEGNHTPDHATIARFRSMHLGACIKETYAQMDYRPADLSENSLENLFIDGTEIEVFANKYKFAWKKAANKNLLKFADKIPAFMEQAEETFALRAMYGNKIQIHRLKPLPWKFKAKGKAKH